MGNICTKLHHRYIYHNDKRKRNRSVPRRTSKVLFAHGVQSIHDGAFNSCRSITTITLPETITTIQEYAFTDCSALESIQLPNSITEIERLAFLRCESLTSIEIPPSTTIIVSITGTAGINILNEIVATAVAVGAAIAAEVTGVL